MDGVLKIPQRADLDPQHIAVGERLASGRTTDSPGPMMEVRGRLDTYQTPGRHGELLRQYGRWLDVYTLSVQVPPQPWEQFWLHGPPGGDLFVAEDPHRSGGAAAGQARHVADSSHTRVTAVPGAPETVNAPLSRRATASPRPRVRTAASARSRLRSSRASACTGTERPTQTPCPRRGHTRSATAATANTSGGWARDGGDLRAGRVHPQMKPALRRRSRWQPGGIERNGHQVVPGDTGQRRSRRDEHGGTLARRHMTERVHRGPARTSHGRIRPTRRANRP